MARPTSYTPEKAAKICALIAEDPRRLSTILDEHDDLPTAKTVWQWLALHGEFREMYARAREQQMEALAEETLDIADETSRDTIFKTGKDGSEYEAPDSEWIARSKLRVDTRKWLMSKLAPRKYGDKITNELTGPNGQPLGSLTDAQIAVALNKLSERVAPKPDDDVSDLV